MKIAGIEKCSFVDYPGHLAAVFFTPGCNWDCYYCHNRGLVDNLAPKPWLDLEVALAWLDDRTDLIDGVVITGGEPTIQPGLAEFIARVRRKGYRVKLDTNGSRPTVLVELLDQGLLDYVAMDIKAPVDRYDDFAGVHIEQDAVNASIDHLLACGIDHEFRTTVTPQLTHTDILAIARRIRGAKRYVLQQYRHPVGARDPRFDALPHPVTWPTDIWPEIQNLVGECSLRGFEIQAKPKSEALVA